MELGEAVSVAKQMRLHYKAFEKLEEFVKEVVKGQSYLNELNAARDKVLAEIVELTAKLGKLKTGAVDAQNVFEALKKNLVSQSKTEQAVVSEAIASARARREAAEKEHVARLQGLKETSDHATKAHGVEMQKLAAARVAAEDKLRTVKAQIEELKTKLA